MKNTFAIRGATTVEMDSPAQVDEAVCELFDRVLEENSLAVEDIAFILLSQTHDIRTRNAATSLRKTGRVDDVPLFCVQEAEVNGMMERVVRILVLVGRPPEGEAHMIYLRRASGLRPDLKK
ncbi:MAG: chorismate mutase [Spirochaetes bacterium]|uniref:chorismate mutase n=1 Tax=Candidatus Aphodenecus pullistercoris TaxID=2840669 RepID=A0A9D9H9P9_9SPIR|nr:chorismate mutase [Candidatus Aphodenecus pullistercoris]